MAANVQITSLHGTTGATTNQVDGQTIKYKMADNDTNDALNPVPIPTSGTQASWLKQFRFNAVTSPTNTINNLKFYTDGANGLGTGLDIMCRTVTSAQYQDPTALQGTLIAAGTPASTSAPASAFTYNSSSPLSISGSISNPTTGLFGDIFQSQATVTSAASQGNSANETLTFAYDES